MGKFYISRGIVIFLILKSFISPGFSQIHQSYSDKSIKESLEYTPLDFVALKYDKAVIIAGWSFDENDLVADQGVEANMDRAISREVQFVSSYTYTAGATGNSLSSAQWANGTGTKYWIIEISTAGFNQITVSSKQRSSNTGPRDFSLQYSISGDAEWMDVDNGIITVANDFNGGTIDDLLLPDTCSDLQQLFIRWVMTSDNAVNDAAAAGAGTSRIDEILIKGVSTVIVDRIVSSVPTMQALIRYENTPFSELNLPDSVWVEFDGNELELLPVVWDSEGYNPNQPGIYFLQGQLILGDGMVNPNIIKATIEIELLPIIKYFDVEFVLDMNNVPGFDPDNDLVLISGSIFNHAIPGTLPDLQVMENSGNGFYRKTLNLQRGSYTYKYYINMGLVNPEPGNYRQLDVDQDKIMNDNWSITAIGEYVPVVVRVFPNPANEILFISSERTICEIRITDLKGIEILKTEVNSFDYNVSVMDIAQGLYLVRVRIGNAYFYHKVFINAR